MEERYAVFMGKPCVDSYYDIREWPEEGGKFLGSFSHDTTGGMVANAACAYAVVCVENLETEQIANKIYEQINRTFGI